MIPSFDNATGYLPKGVHDATWDEFIGRFAINEKRKDLIEGLLNAIRDLKSCGCRAIYADGSFSTDKEMPGDIDVCWDIAGADLFKLKMIHPVFFDFDNERGNQKAKYGCEFFPAQLIEAKSGKPFLEYFQEDENDVPKGIVKILIDKL